jgi:hypothetical protein
MPFTRPNGVSCSGYVYPDKKNTYEKLKEFLFETDSGRTDVVFFASAATAYEPNQHNHVADPDSYHYTGGLIDGISKAIIQGSGTRSPRPMYATGVQFAYTCNQIPGFDRWNSATWRTPNNTGVGGYLTGCSTAYDNYYYYRLTSDPVGNAGNSNTGLHFISLDESSSYQYFDEFDTGALINLNPYALWANSFQDPNEFSNNNSTKEVKQAKLMSLGLTCFLTTPVRNNALSITSPFNATFTFTPEQPQRYWERENSWYILRTSVFPIGIAYIDSNDTVSEIFPDATTYGYIPAGLTVGQTSTAAKALLAAGKLRIVTLDAFSTTILKDENAVAVPGEFNWFPSPQESTVFKTALNATIGAKKILTRYLTVDEIITIRSLNISANNSAITNYTAWKAVDGFRNGDYVVFRSPWANPESSPPITTDGSQSLVTTKVDKKFGLATSTDSGVSSWQAGLPYLFEWGNRPNFLSTNAFNLIDFGVSRAAPLTESPSISTQLLGFPRLLPTIAPVGFFRLSSASDSSKLADPSYSKFKDRCLVIKPNLGVFFNTINTGGGGAKEATTKVLLKGEKSTRLSMFRSSNFKYCVNSYGIDKYAGDNIASSSLIRLTIHSRDDASSPFTLRTSTNITQTNPVVPNTQKRTVQRYNHILSLDLSTINTNFTMHEIRLGFLGKDVAGTPTNGDLMITTHYGIDTDNQDGIAFSKLDTTYAYRSGDAAYQNDAGAVGGGGRYALYTEFFKAIFERQTSPTFNAGVGLKPKLVIMIEVGVWELANPNFSYNGFQTWSYYTDNVPVVGGGSNGVLNFNFGFDAITPVINCAIIAGFKREEIVLCFYTPSLLAPVNVPSKGTLDGINYDTALDEATFVSTKNQRNTFIRATEIFVQNNLTYGGGYFTPSSPNPPLVFDGTTNNTAKNSVYLNFSSMTGLTSILNNITGFESTWYDTTDEVLTYKYYSQAGALAVGSWVMDYLAAQTSQTFFVPPWIPPFSRALNFTTDPVSGGDLNLVTVSLDPVDIEPYLAAYDVLCDQGNIQAKKTLSKFKTKTLQ